MVLDRNDSDSNWLSLLLGEQVTPQDLTSVEQVAALREVFAPAMDRLNEDLPDGVVVHEGVVLRERRDGSLLTAEVCLPEGRGARAVFLYLHGGGWCLGAPRGHRRLAAQIAASGFAVVNVDYSLAPEHPFPWAVEDVVYAARWITKYGSRYRIDHDGLFIGGDSSGANLSAAVIVGLTDPTVAIEGGDLSGLTVNFAGAVFAYGVFDFPLMMQEPGAHRGRVEVMWNRAYLGPTFFQRHRDPLISPVYGRYLDRFPPCYLTVGDQDQLIGQSLAMTKALAFQNVPTTLSVVAGADHAFLSVPDRVPAARAELARILEWLEDVGEFGARGAQTSRATDCAKTATNRAQA